MRVLLLQDVPGLGKKFDIKEVKTGFARNFLFPKKLAILFDKKAILIQEKVLKKKALQKKEKEKLIEFLKDLKIEIKVNLNEKGKAFEKIDTQKISKILKQKGIEIKKENIELEKEIKKIGNYKIPIKVNGNKIEIEVSIKSKNQ